MPLKHYDIYVKNVSGGPLFLGVHAKNTKGVWLDNNAEVYLYNVDLHNKKVRDTLKNLFDNGRIVLKAIDGLKRVIESSTAVATTEI